YKNIVGGEKPPWVYDASEILRRQQMGIMDEIYAEAFRTGADEIWLHLFTPDGTLFHTDRVRLTIIDKPDLVAHRPQTRGGAPTHYQWPHYDMFRRRAVPDSEEINPGV